MPSANSNRLFTISASAENPKPETRERALTEAHAAPRCQHVKVNGSRCASPALANQPLCHFHHLLFSERPAQRLNSLPSFEDANGIQCALMEVATALLTNRVTPKTAALLLYALQIASSNLKQMNLDPSSAPYTDRTR